MPINFFDETQKTSSSNNQFGLCDDQSPAENLAYIDEINHDKWIGIVDNPTNKQTDFYPIDHCVPLYRTNGDLERRCDGVLRFNKNLVFVELKGRVANSHGWLADGKRQLTVTIQKFKENHTIADFSKIEAYVCNSLRPMASKNYSIEIKKFKDETGLILNVQQKISI
jgi:hypothetical protein